MPTPPKSVSYRGVGRVKIFDPVNRCIYCGQPNGAHSDEHIIPLALGGNMVLPNASCTCCQRIINEQVESPLLDVTRGMLGMNRGRLQLPSRNKRRGRKKKEYPKPRLTIVGIDSVHRQQEVDVSAFPLLLNAFESGPPGFVYESMNHPFRPGQELYKVIKYRDDELQKFAGPGERVLPPVVITPIPFMRLIAKIAHSMTAALIGYDAFEPYLRGVILGTDNKCFHYFGSQAMHEPDPGGLHELSVFPGIPPMGLVNQPEDSAHVCANIRLFCRFGMPEYMAIVGKLKGEFKFIATLE